MALAGCWRETWRRKWKCIQITRLWNLFHGSLTFDGIRISYSGAVFGAENNFSFGTTTARRKTPWVFTLDQMLRGWRWRSGKFNRRCDIFWYRILPENDLHIYSYSIFGFSNTSMPFLFATCTSCCSSRDAFKNYIPGIQINLWRYHTTLLHIWKVSLIITLTITWSITAVINHFQSNLIITSHFPRVCNK